MIDEKQMIQTGLDGFQIQAILSQVLKRELKPIADYIIAEVKKELKKKDKE